MIAYNIMNCDSNEKQVFKAGDNNVIDVTSPALNTTQREMNVGPHVDTDGL